MEFCRQAGLNYRAAQKFFQRQSSPDTESLVKIAAYFQVDLNWLIRGESPSSKLMARAARKLKLFRKRKGWSLAEFEEKLSRRDAAPPNPDECRRAGRKRASPAQLPVARTLELFEKGSLVIAMDLLEDIAGKMEIPLPEFLRDEDPAAAQPPELKIFQTSSSARAPGIRGEDYVSIPLTKSAIAAGQPIIADNNVEDYVLLHIRAAGKRNNLVACRVDGESMEPTLHSGDIVVIDRDDKKIVKNKIYAIFYEEGLTAKYVERQKDLLILRPINPNAQVQVVNLNECPDPIVGRVIGAWKEM